MKKLAIMPACYMGSVSQASSALMTSVYFDKREQIKRSGKVLTSKTSKRAFLGFLG
jgi:hypothetical protein